MQPNSQIVASPIEWAYLAGIVDGEGCVRALELIPGDREKRRGNVSPRYRIELSICNTSEALINWVHERFRGNIYVSHKPGQWKATRTCWKIFFAPALSEELLRGMYPYLIIKKAQADLCFRLREIVRARTPTNRGYKFIRRLTNEEIKERHDIVQALKDAKKVA